MPYKTILDISVTPKSSRNRIIIQDGKTIKAYLTAPPVDGKANAALIALLSKILKVPKSNIEIIHGRNNKKKRLQFEDITEEELISKIEKG